MRHEVGPDSCVKLLLFGTDWVIDHHELEVICKIIEGAIWYNVAEEVELEIVQD